MRRRRWHGIQTFINICGIIIIATVIMVCGVSLRQGHRSWSSFSESNQNYFEDSLDIFQTEIIAAEIQKARQFKTIMPKKYKLTDGNISPYDDLFMAYADSVGWDWLMLAAVSYVESHFKPEVVSPSGAKGLMQLMPRTAANYGCEESMIHNPEQNIRAGALLLHDLEKRLRKRNVDSDVTYFCLAGFHAGLGHIYEAMTLADSLGYNPTLWHDNVEVCLQYKAEPEYYNLPYLRLGKFNGKVTSAYIREVFGYYEAFKRAKRN